MPIGSGIDMSNRTLHRTFFLSGSMSWPLMAAESHCKCVALVIKIKLWWTGSNPTVFAVQYSQWNIVIYSVLFAATRWMCILVLCLFFSLLQILGKIFAYKKSPHARTHTQHTKVVRCWKVAWICKAKMKTDQRPLGWLSSDLNDILRIIFSGLLCKMAGSIQLKSFR